MNIKALNLHGKSEYISPDINVKIVKRMLKLVKKLKFHIKEKHVRQDILLMTDAENY